LGHHDFGTNNSKNIALLWNPAMNVSFHFNYSPSSTNAVFTDPRTGAGPAKTESSSWNMGVEYSF
jgi:hypothetical protein